MYSDTVAALLPAIESIHASDVRKPDRPYMEVAADAYRFATQIRAGVLGNDLARLRLDADVAEQLQRAADALIEVSTVWTSTRFGNDPARAAELAKNAEAEYQRIRTALMFVTGNDKGVRRALASASDDATDRSAALFQIAHEIERHRDKFRATDSVDPDELAAAARAAANTLMQADAARPDARAGRAKDLRDRLFTHIDALMDRVLASANFHLAGSPSQLDRFVRG